MSKKLTTAEFKKRLYEIYGDTFEVLSEYEANNKKIKLKCKKCGNIIFKKPVKMTGVSREGCYICSGKNKYKTKDFLQQEVDKIYPNNYEIIGDYIGARQPLLVKNNKCGHEYFISPDNLLRGRGCPRCSIKQSSYMDIVEEYLETHNITFEKEKIFSDCVNIRVLPFDYYIPQLNCCIEVDGEFHYERGYKNINDRSGYYQVHKRDVIKDNYCKEKGIKLIRLPYYNKDNFCSILAKELQVNTEIIA